MRLVTRRLETSFGVLPARVREARATALAPVLCLHGAGGMARNFGSVLRRLDDGPAAAIDMPGRGRSTAAPLETVEQLARCALEAAGELWPHARTIVLVGHSLGGAVALEAARLEPERLGALVLLGTGARLSLAARHAALARRDFDALLRQLEADGTPPVTLAQLREVGPAAVAADLSAAERFDPLAAARHCRCPALLLTGAQDPVAPPEAVRELAAALAGPCEVQVLPGVAHLPMVERPAETARAIERVRASLGTSARAPERRWR